MDGSTPTRYELVSRRAALKATLGAGAFALLPVACSNGDSEVFAGATAETIPTTTTTTTAQTTSDAAGATPTTVRPPDPDELAVEGEMVISFTYTQGAGGKNEPPYIAVWIEDVAGELVSTVALWFEQRRRGQRWLDHLARWYGQDLDSITTISSATRAAGSYDVVWDGTIWDGTGNGVPVAAGDYVLCIEAVREDGPYSLICEPVSLNGSLPEMALPDVVELSAGSVRIDV